MKNTTLAMTNQTVLGKFSGTESVCKTCKHLDTIEGRYFCKLLGALLAEQTLYLPCDLKEPIKKS
ncbi:MAG: hypothetical protein NWF03_04750 [Candidatus Bathyarchaeota archaeon]|nr:hypothetical protein [Candidatus Bathyarchaeota archaeon]